MKNYYIALLGLLASSLSTTQLTHAAGEAMARDYVAGPDGLSLAVMYYEHKLSDTYIADNQKVDADLNVNTGVARYVHFMEVGGMLIDPQIILPFGSLDMTIPNAVDNKNSSIGDVILLSSFWFVNDPVSKTYFAFTPYLTIPTGSYDANIPATSLGSNRWSYTTEFGMSKGIGDKSFIDLIAAVDFYGKNDNYMGMNQEKEPVFSLQTIYSYNLTPSMWASAKYSYLTGGETKLDHMDQDDKVKTHKLTLGLAKQFNKSNNIQLEYNHDLEINNAFETRGIKLRYVYSY